MLLKLQKPPEVKGYGQGGGFQIWEETKEEASLALEETWTMTTPDYDWWKHLQKQTILQDRLEGSRERPAAFDEPDALSPGCIAGEQVCPNLGLQSLNDFAWIRSEGLTALGRAAPNNGWGQRDVSGKEA